MRLMLSIVLMVVLALTATAQENARPLRRGDAKDRTALRTVRRWDPVDFVVELKPQMLKELNPYTAYVLTVDVSAKVVKGMTAGESVAALTGFFSGSNTYIARWMVNAADGRYTYAVKVGLPGEEKPLAFDGSFTVTGDSRAAAMGPLKISEKNPLWFADRNGAPFFFSGVWAHSSLDVNQMNGRGYGAWRDANPSIFNQYYDNAVSGGFIDKNGAPTRTYFGKIDTLVEDLAANRINMVCITADHMAWGFQSATNWAGKRAGEFTDPFRYDPNSGLVWDYFLDAARQKGIFVKINLQEFCQGKYDQHPFNAIEGVDMKKGWEQPDDMVTNETAVKAWQAWVTYLVRRYSPYNNVHFQMGNEPPGDGYTLGQAKWAEFDRMTMETVKAAAAYPVLYSSGAPVGCGQLNQADYDVEHHNSRKLGGVTCFQIKHGRDVPYHVEEIEAYNGKNKEEWLRSCRYLKFGAFVQGAYASALVMWSWQPPEDALTRYYQSTQALWNFVDPIVPELFDFKPDNAFITAAPAEIAWGLKSAKHAIVYMQKDDPKINKKDTELPQVLTLKLEDGKVTVDWFDPSRGAWLQPRIQTVVKDGILALIPPKEFTDDIAVRVSY